MYKISTFFGDTMKGWKIIKPFLLKESESNETVDSTSISKVKITKALITLSDVLRYSDELDGESVILGNSGIGVISETDANLFGLEKGQRVYIEPIVTCGTCENCKKGDDSHCTELKRAGIDFDGFLCDFASVKAENLFALPDSVADFNALFLDQISLAISVVDKLKIQKGDYVAIVGANNFGNILAQLLIYYQAVPIVVTNNLEDYKIAKDSGIYYVLGPDDNWQKEVANITSARMTKNVVYISDCDIPTTKAFALASFNAGIAYTGVSNKNNSVSFAQAIKKQLKIYFINNKHGNTAASINLIANKAINLSNLKLDTAPYDKVPEVLQNMQKTLEEKGKIYETVIDLV